MFDEDQSWLPFLSNKIVLVPVICHYIRRPASWACNGQVHHDVVQFGFVCFACGEVLCRLVHAKVLKCDCKVCGVIDCARN